MADADSYLITLDGLWSLLNFYELPRAFSQVYAFHYALEPEATILDPERVSRAFSSYPWKGGFSTINFFSALYDAIPSDLQPKVRSIQYASPGRFELEVWLLVAFTVGRTVKALVARASEITKLYNDIQDGIQKRNLGHVQMERERLQLSKDQLDFFVQSANVLSEAMGFKNLAALQKMTRDPLKTLKILLSYYRRAKELANLELAGKAVFPENEQENREELQDRRDLP